MDLKFVTYCAELNVHMSFFMVDVGIELAHVRNTVVSFPLLAKHKKYQNIQVAVCAP